MINNHFGINTCETDIDFYDTFSWNEGENAKSPQSSTPGSYESKFLREELLLLLLLLL